MADENWRSDLKKKTFERHFDIIYVTPSTSIRTLLTILCFVNVNKINKDKLPGSSFGYFLIYIFSLFFFFTLFLFSFASLKSEFLLPFYQRYKLYYVYFSPFFCVCDFLISFTHILFLLLLVLKHVLCVICFRWIVTLSWKMLSNFIGLLLWEWNGMRMWRLE